jgi:predicted transcriptional regulator
MGKDTPKRPSTINAAGKIRTVVYLDSELKRALRIAAAERECTPSEVVEEALRKVLRV